MKTTNLGTTSLKISAMGLGIMRMCEKTPKQAANALEAAFDNGINFIDSADIYGQGESEEIFGKALKMSKIDRKDLFIQSKVGIVVSPERSEGSRVFGGRYEFSKDHILTAVDGILKRMDIDYLDSLLLHRPDSLMDLEGVKEAFDILQAEGKVRFFGVSNFNSEQFLMLQENISQPLMFNQLQFGIMHTGMIDSDFNVNVPKTVAANHDFGLLDFLRRKHITLQAWSPFQYGQFEGSFIDNPDFPTLNNELTNLANKYNVGKNAIAAAWILRWPGQAQVIIGTMTPAHIIDSAKASEIELTRQEWYDLYMAAGHDLP